MADILAFDITQMRQDAQTMGTALRNARDQLRGVYEDVAQLNAMWEGSAKDAFARQFSTDREQFNLICEILQKIVSNMEEAQKRYVQCEARVQDVIEQIRIEG